MWSIIVPVKNAGLAKTRFAGASQQWRAALARALAADTVEVLLSVPAVDLVLVITDDAPVAAEAGRLGAHVITDIPGGLNASLRHAASALGKLGRHGVLAALPGDLPALRGRDLHDVLDVALLVDSAFVADASGTGTTLLTAASDRFFVPRYGAGSAGRHLAAGAVPLNSPPSLRQDVDTVADLHAALALGAGSRTTAIAGELTALATLSPPR